MHIYKNWRLLIISIFCGLWMPLLVAHADILPQCSLTYGDVAGSGAYKICGLCDFWHLANNVVNFLLFTVSIPLLTIVFLYGGTRWVTSGGSPSGISAGKDAMTSAIIGLLIAFSGWAVINTIVTSLANGEISAAWSKIPSCVKPIIPPPNKLPSVGTETPITTTSHWALQICPITSCAGNLDLYNQASDQGRHATQEACRQVRPGGSEPDNWRCVERTRTATVTRPADSPEGTGSHEAMANLLRIDGIPIISSGGCSDKTRSNCTSLDGIHPEVVSEVLTLKLNCRCDVKVTGGTEVGHSTSGTHNHGNGYKIDIQSNANVDQFLESPGYLTRNGSREGSHGGPLYIKTSNPKIEYVKESNPPHWDITVRP